MFESLLEWCQNPIFMFVYMGIAPSGDKSYIGPVPIKCYKVDETTLITDKYGKQYAASTVLYIPPEYVLTDDELISFDGNIRYEIHRLGGFSDGNTGLTDMRVVYL